MSVNSITSSSSSTDASSSTDKTQLSGTKDEFLKMFMAQLQNQDPLQPQDNSQMVAQLATFTQVEQAEQTNQQLSNLTASQSSAANASMAALVGRNVSANIGDTEIKDPSNVPPIDVKGDTKGATIDIKDSNGKVVRQLPIPDGGGTVKWDGKDANGNLVAKGNYTLSVDSPNTDTDISATWSGKVDALELNSSGSRLVMGGITVAPSSISSIGAEAATAQTVLTDSITSAINAASTGNSTSNQGSNS
ncbi:MAG: flagellar hook capping FlgD N-terminal domain-containing protein [Kofleriaceae bacterium]